MRALYKNEHRKFRKGEEVECLCGSTDLHYVPEGTPGDFEDGKRDVICNRCGEEFIVDHEDEWKRPAKK